jgi:hypothetical protein
MCVPIYRYIFLALVKYGYISNENLPRSVFRKAICVLMTITLILCNYLYTFDSIIDLLYVIIILLTYSFIKIQFGYIGEIVFKKYILLILLPLTVWASEDEYIIDKSHFSIGFLVEHVGYAKTLGMFRDIDGSYIHDVKNKKINDINIVINTDSVFTNDEKRDEHLKSPDFLHVDKYPEMVFKLQT